MRLGERGKNLGEPGGAGSFFRVIGNFDLERDMLISRRIVRSVMPVYTLDELRLSFRYSDGEICISFLNVLEKASWSSKPKELAITDTDNSVVVKSLQAFFIFKSVRYCFGDTLNLS